MAVEFDLAELITSRSIDNAEPAAPITDIDAAGGCIVAGSDLLFNNFSVVASSGFTQAAVGIATAPFGTDVVGSDVNLSFQIGG